MRLILCVDRDNDFGEKAGLESPIIGRRKNFAAAQKLIMTDPEDSDANTLFASIKEYDLLKSEGEEVAIATLCGSRSIGRESDERIRIQLDAVLARINPSSVILFDDGAEDEALAPIIESRIRVDRKVRVVVQQSERIESFYYMAKKILLEDKARKKVMIPGALACIVWALAAFAGRPEIGTGAIVFLVGVTLLIWAFRLENAVINVGRDMREAVRSGAISVYIYMFAPGIFSIGIIIGYAESSDIGILQYRVLEFLRASIWLFLGAIWLVVAGKALDDYLRLDKRDYSLWSVSMALLTAGFLLSGIFVIFEYVLGYGHHNVLDATVSIMIAAVVAGVGIVGRSYIKDHVSPPRSAEDWRF